MGEDNKYKAVHRCHFEGAFKDCFNKKSQDSQEAVYIFSEYLVPDFFKEECRCAYTYGMSPRNDDTCFGIFISLLSMESIILRASTNATTQCFGSTFKIFAVKNTESQYS